VLAAQAELLVYICSVRGRRGHELDAPDATPEVARPARTDLAARLGKLSDRHPSWRGYADAPARSLPEQRAASDDRRPADSTDSAWRRAVDRFTADWRQHQERWPRSSDKAERVKLSLEAERQLARGCDQIRAVEPQITDRLRAIEAEQPDRRLAGLKHRVKDDDRTKEKAATYLRTTPGFSPDEALAISDAIRYTFVYRDSGYCDGVQADITRMKAAGFELLRLRNHWADSEYKGINAQWREGETGQRFEVQFHTTASFEAKELTHDAYERVRDPAEATSRRELQELARLQGALSALIPRPPGADDIRNHSD
jgi:hypothetical protein